MRFIYELVNKELAAQKRKYFQTLSLFYKGNLKLVFF